MGPPRVGLLACERVLHCGVKGRVRAAQRGGWGSRVVVIYPRRAARPAQRAPEVISSPLGVDLQPCKASSQLRQVACRPQEKSHSGARESSSGDGKGLARTSRQTGHIPFASG